MASDWSANLDEVTTDGGNVVATIRFTNAKTKDTVIEKLRADDLTRDRIEVA